MQEFPFWGLTLKGFNVLLRLGAYLLDENALFSVLSFSMDY